MGCPGLWISKRVYRCPNPVNTGSMVKGQSSGWPRPWPIPPRAAAINGLVALRNFVVQFALDPNNERHFDGPRSVPAEGSSSIRGPVPDAAKRSPGLWSAQLLSDRQPHPIHSVRFSRMRCSWSMRVSRWARHFLDSLSQSRLFGVRPSGSSARASPISFRVSPSDWATLTTEIRRSAAR